MPYTPKQKKAACADYGRAKKGKAARTMKGASKSTLKHMCTAPTKKRKG